MSTKVLGGGGGVFLNVGVVLFKKVPQTINYIKDSWQSFENLNHKVAISMPSAFVMRSPLHLFSKYNIFFIPQFRILQIIGIIYRQLMIDLFFELIGIPIYARQRAVIVQKFSFKRSIGYPLDLLKQPCFYVERFFYISQNPKISFFKANYRYQFLVQNIVFCRKDFVLLKQQCFVFVGDLEY
eukprot:TRINITY_DN8820_c0_g1_i10.p2 TRINITY_DN8820_c0_g1~~TRINITY_DN8820_c0_g1_i10.p2  ORF type:complete len:183 (-),score=2.98 TRINITY_DN8820_c0_g1_i10:40-588(-)